MTHIGKVYYDPSLQGFWLKCKNCGGTFFADLEGKEIEVEGSCNPPETLGIHVKEEVGVKDHFGGA